MSPINLNGFILRVARSAVYEQMQLIDFLLPLLSSDDP